MAEMTPAASFVLSPKGPYSLAASIRCLEGFAPAAYDSESATNLEMAFCVDGYWDRVVGHRTANPNRAGSADPCGPYRNAGLKSSLLPSTPHLTRPTTGLGWVRGVRLVWRG